MNMIYHRHALLPIGNIIQADNLAGINVSVFLESNAEGEMKFFPRPLEIFLEIRSNRRHLVVSMGLDVTVLLCGTD